MKPTTKTALKTLNVKEQKLKDDMFNLIVKSKASNQEVVRCLAFLLNKFKRL
jgi:hypothetical protein